MACYGQPASVLGRRASCSAMSPPEHYQVMPLQICFTLNSSGSDLCYRASCLVTASLSITPPSSASYMAAAGQSVRPLRITHRPTKNRQVISRRIIALAVLRLHKAVFRVATHLLPASVSSCAVRQGCLSAADQTVVASLLQMAATASAAAPSLGLSSAASRASFC